MATAEALKQFGTPIDGLDYQPRQGAYGLCLKDGRLAIAQIGFRKFVYDLPGGGVDEGETPEKAVVREFLEEVGILVKPDYLVCEILHYFVHENGTPYNNRCRFYVVKWVDDRPGQKIETDHELVWMTPLEAIKSLKNDGFAWAVTCWLRGLR
jgi:8-oxo-dGTP diphosphatase